MQSIGAGNEVGVMPPSVRLPTMHLHLLSSMQVTVYSTPWCPDCRVAKRFLDLHKILYTEINIETTPGAADEVVARTGKRAIPQFVIDGEWVQPYVPGEGFLYEEMAKRLGVENQ
jgi:glutaredoxin